MNIRVGLQFKVVVLTNLLSFSGMLTWNAVLSQGATDYITGLLLVVNGFLLVPPLSPSPSRPLSLHTDGPLGSPGLFNRAPRIRTVAPRVTGAVLPSSR